MQALGRMGETTRLKKKRFGFVFQGVRSSQVKGKIPVSVKAYVFIDLFMHIYFHSFVIISVKFSTELDQQEVTDATEWVPFTLPIRSAINLCRKDRPYATF